MKILIKNVRIITMDANMNEYDQGCIGVEGAVIAYIGGEEQLPQDFKADKVIDGKGMLALPGFVNAHTHSAMSIFRGYANDIPLMEWLSEKIWPMEDRLMPGDAYWLSLLSIAEMIMSGVTVFADMYMFMDQTAKAVARSGIRAVLARGLQGPDPKAEQRLAENRRLWEEWNGQAEGRIRIMVGPHAVYTCDREYLEKCMDLAQELGAGIHIHLAETRHEVEECRRKYGKTPVEYLEGLGLFKHHTLAVHCVHLSREDMDILKDNGVHVVHCPISNLKLGSGVAKTVDLVDKGINVALGTDSAASNNSLSIMREMNFAALLSKGINENPVLLPARQVFSMATKNGAEALGWEDEIGCLEVGKKADIILLRQDGPHCHPTADPITHLVYSGRDSDVDTVIVNGKILMEGRQFTTVDLQEVYYKVEMIQTRIMGRI
ncbi:MAG: amidohydrolase [Clostridiales bacterium]|jgi:5-methylthioadenosine/S-adenosylhomocysteine deaminase|nr:amidohydrolase [Clostridiales bacterium]